MQILSFEGDGVFNVEIVNYNFATEGKHYFDMQRVDTRIKLSTGRMKIVFLNRFVQNLLVS